MAKKLDILRLFAEEPLTPFALANLLDIKPNYGRQIVLRLRRQGLIFPHPTLAGGRGYSLTDKGEARIAYLANKEKKEAIEERKQRGMYLHEVIAEGLPREIEERIRSEFNITSVERLGGKRLDEIALPQKICQETSLLKLRRGRKLEYLELPFDAWLRLLQNMSKQGPKPQHLSLEEVLIISALTKQEKGEFLVTKDGEILCDPGRGYLTMQAAAILPEYRKEKKTR